MFDWEQIVSFHFEDNPLNEPWHYTTILDLLDHWQALIAGGLGFAAAIVAVILTLRTERRKLQRELDALRKSLAVELRQVVPRALGAGKALRDLGRAGQQVTARMVENYARTPTPMVFPTIGNKIGLLGDDAMGVVIIYSLLELGRSGIVSLVNSRDPDNISPETIAASAIPFLAACEYALSVLPKLKTGVTAHDEKDAELIQNIKAATSQLGPHSV
jgi:hypothetical protein